MTDGQTEVEVTITQGEDSSPEYINKIATHKFKLPPDRPAGCPIKVTYKYDVSQMMHCMFEDVQSGRSLEVDFCVGQNGEMLPSDLKQKSDQLEVFTVQ
jgi:molecular chaperone DnaK